MADAALGLFIRNTETYTLDWFKGDPSRSRTKMRELFLMVGDELLNPKKVEDAEKIVITLCKHDALRDLVNATNRTTNNQVITVAELICSLPDKNLLDLYHKAGTDFDIAFLNVVSEVGLAPYTKVQLHLQQAKNANPEYVPL